MSLGTNDNTVDLEETTEQERLTERGRIVAFCLNNGYQFDDSDDEVLVYIPRFKRTKS